MTWHRLRQEN